MILLSAHTDKTVSSDILSFRDGCHRGLLDNFIGVLLTYLVVYNFSELERDGTIRVWHNTNEECGGLGNFLDGIPELGTDDVVLVIDTAGGEAYEGRDFVLENISGFDVKDLDFLYHELSKLGYKFDMKLYSGKVTEADEAWRWKDLGIRVMSFIVPVEGHHHDVDSRVLVDSVKRCQYVLEKLIMLLSDLIKNHV